MTRALYLGLFAAASAMTAALPVAAQTAPSVANTDAAKTAKYRTLMEVNGTAQNIRAILKTTKDAIRTALLEDAGRTSMTFQEEARFSAIADPVLALVEVTIAQDIASHQSGGLSFAEMDTLIAVNSKPIAVRYNAQKFTQEDEAAKDVQALMVDTVVRIVRKHRGEAYTPDNAELAARLATEGTPELAAALTLLVADGASEIVRTTVNNVYVSLIVEEVDKYIEVNALSETDRNRMSTIVADEMRQLGDNILKLAATRYTEVFTKTELVQLAKDFDNPAQRKLNQIRLDDDGSIDQRSEDAIRAAAINIVEAYQKP